MMCKTSIVAKRGAGQALNLPRLILVATVVLGFFAVPTTAIAADAPAVFAQLDRETIYEGESVIYDVRVANLRNPPQPDMSAFDDDFAVRFQGSQDRSSRQVAFVNGRMTQREQLMRIFRYELTPKRAGRLTLPAATVEADGKTYRSQELVLRVKAPEEQDLVKMTITAEPKAVYPMQAFEIVLTVAVKALPTPDEDQQPVVAGQNGPPMLSIPWVASNPSNSEEPFPEGIKAEVDWRNWLGRLQSRQNEIGFGINGLRGSGVSMLFDIPELTFLPTPKRIQLPQKDGTLADYWQYQFRRRFIAERMGEYEFGPVTLKGIIATGVAPTSKGERSLLGEPIFAVAKPVTVFCKDVPLDGRPDSYVGAVGVFTDFSAELVPKKASVGTPMTLTLTLKGTGSLDDVVAPDLAKLPKVNEAFKVYEPTREQKGRQCVFTYTIRPKKAGVEQFPAIAASYYDVNDSKYVTLNTKPIPVDITKADRLSQGDILSAGPTTNGASRELHRSEEGLYANITSFSALRNQAVQPIPWLIGAGTLCGLYGGIALVVLRVRKRQGDVAFVRRRGAVARAKKRLGAGGDETRMALVGLVADVANIPEAGATTKDVCRVLGEYGVEESLIERLSQTLEECDAARYAPSKQGADRLSQDAKHILSDLVRALKKKKRL